MPQWCAVTAPRAPAAHAADARRGSSAEFLQNLTAQANTVSSEEKKNTITEAHLLRALKDLDFQHYVAQVESMAPAAGDKPPPKKKSKKDNSGLSQEELLRMQQALFAESKQKMESQMSGAPIT